MLLRHSETRQDPKKASNGFFLIIFYMHKQKKEYTKVLPIYTQNIRKNPISQLCLIIKIKPFKFQKETLGKAFLVQLVARKKMMSYLI